MNTYASSPEYDHERALAARRARPAAQQIDIDQVAPRITWDQLYAYLLANFEQGEHVTIVGTTGTGKSHLALAIAEIRAYVIVIACKPKDPLIDSAVAHGYHLNQKDELDIEYVDGRPLHPRIIYWPRLGERARRKLPNHKVLAAEKAHQKPRVGSAIGYIRNEGHWCLVVDEGTWVCKSLRLQGDIDDALIQFRSIDASIVILGQRPSWMGQFVMSQPTHLFLFQTSHSEDRKALGDISGVDTKAVREIVGTLDHEAHEFLYIDTSTRKMFRSVAPPR
jgi:energy-coupling factor transporter ATP-binding protein EcfA2